MRSLPLALCATGVISPVHKQFAAGWRVAGLAICRLGIAAALLFAGLPVLGQVAELDDQLLAARQRLLEVEARSSRTSLELVEPLADYAAQNARLGLFGETHELLDRAVQIVRMNEGLFAAGQIPYQRLKLENFAAAGDWERTRQQLEHLLWLYTYKIERIDADLLGHLDHLSNMHLRAISEDASEYQGYHFRRSVYAAWMALEVGQAIYPADDTRLVPLLYKLVHNYHLQDRAIDAGGRLGYDLRLVSYNASWVRDKAETHEFFYYAGLRLLNRIQAIYQSREGVQSEANAMAELYLGDWHALFSKPEAALASYEKAFSLLEATDADPAAVQAYLGRPQLIPEPEFYPTLSHAMADLEQESQLAGPVTVQAAGGRADVAGDTVGDSADNSTEASNGNSLNPFQFSFTEWSANFPYVQAPAQLSGAQQRLPQARASALFSFNIGGLEEVGRLLRGKDVISIGSVEDVKLLRGALSDDEDKLLIRRLESLRFRPRLIDGVPHSSEARLTYSLANL